MRYRSIEYFGIELPITKLQTSRKIQEKCKLLYIIAEKCYKDDKFLSFRLEEVITWTSVVITIHFFLKSDLGEGVWSIEQTFLSQPWNFVTGVGMKIRLHANCEWGKVHCCCYSFVFLHYIHMTFLEDFNNSHKFWADFPNLVCL